MSKLKTIHTSRTIMFAELSKVMDFAMQDNSYFHSLNQNVINKKTQSGIEKTTRYLTSLYGFDQNDPSFVALKYFWQMSDDHEKPILSLVYAIGNDDLLAESIPVVLETLQGEKVTIEKIEQNIESFHPNRYSENTRRSLAQNIASSWKQAGFITGKTKNIRTQPPISYNILAFALFLAYLNGLRGEFILTSKWPKALSLSESKLRDLAVEASKRDVIQYQFAGGVTAISFSNLTNKLQINVI
ncbi:MAG: hypothetical protein FD155_3236 [Bacteroidetes bacterium]|nr:MAG: hypothetical protein FD155_3236 [Bacteroidota bacterium]